MNLIKFDTQGESHTAMVNPEQVAFLAEGIYGTSIHFASGEYIICQSEIDDVAARLFGAAPREAPRHAAATAPRSQPHRRGGDRGDRAVRAACPGDPAAFARHADGSLRCMAALSARIAGLVLLPPGLLNTLFKAGTAVGIAGWRNVWPAAVTLLAAVAAALGRLILQV